MELKNKDNYWYMLPICKGHNNKKYDRGGSSGRFMIAKDTAFAIQIPIHPNYTRRLTTTNNSSVDPYSQTFTKFLAKIQQKVLPTLTLQVRSIVSCGSH